MRFKELLTSIDWVLLSSAVLLILLGLAMLLSSTYNQDTLSPLFWRQLMAAGLGITLMAAVIKIPYHTWDRYAPTLYGIGLAGLIAVNAIGPVIRGTISRLEFFGFQIQPSELMKAFLIVTLAWFFSRYKSINRRLVAISAALVVVPVALVLSEPDIGMAFLLLSSWASLIIFLGLPWRQVLVLGVIAALLAAGGWQWGLLDYQKERILTFLNPAQDPLRAGYNINQSMIALGSGQISGRGLGHGPQSQLQFLPEQHTDFIFASIGEELGFIGLTIVLALYAVILWRLLVIARSTTDMFGQLFCVGVYSLLIVSLLVSAGMNMGLLPVTGIPLPLVSYGGSNLLVTLLLVGVAESVQVYSKFRRVLPLEISSIT